MEEVREKWVITPSEYIDNFTREAGYHKDEGYKVSEKSAISLLRYSQISIGKIIGNIQKYAILEAMQHIVDNQS